MCCLEFTATNPVYNLTSNMGYSRDELLGIRDAMPGFPKLSNDVMGQIRLYHLNILPLTKRGYRGGKYVQRSIPVFMSDRNHSSLEYEQHGTQRSPSLCIIIHQHGSFCIIHHHTSSTSGRIIRLSDWSYFIIMHYNESACTTMHYHTS